MKKQHLITKILKNTRWNLRLKIYKHLTAPWHLIIRLYSLFVAFWNTAPLILSYAIRRSDFFWIWTDSMCVTAIPIVYRRWIIQPYMSPLFKLLIKWTNTVCYSFWVHRIATRWVHSNTERAKSFSKLLENYLQESRPGDQKPAFDMVPDMLGLVQLDWTNDTCVCVCAISIIFRRWIIMISR